MTSIYHLPDELMSHVLTLGCEIEEFWEGRQYSSHSKSYPRRRKKFALYASLVCKWWQNLVYSPSNRHLWICHIKIDYTIPSVTNIFRNDDLVKDIAVARHWLYESQGCDVDADLFPNMLSAINGDVDLSTASSQSTRIRLLLHSIKLLSNFIPQWRNISFVSNQPEVLYLIYSILNQIKRAPNLIRLEISQGDLGYPYLLAPNDLHSVASDLYDEDVSGSSPYCSPQFRFNGPIVLEGIDLRYVERFPLGLKNLIANHCESNEALTWIISASIAPTLTSLKLQLDPLTRSLPFDKIRLSRQELSSLSELTIIARPGLLCAALETFDFQSLTRLIFEHRSYFPAPADIELQSFTDTRLPALEYLSISTDSESALRLTQKISAPRLKAIEFCVPPMDRHQHLKSLRSSLVKLLDAPECASFTGWNKALIFFFASFFDFAVTETLKLSLSGVESYDSCEDVTFELPISTFPVLSSVSLYGECAITFMQCSVIQNLRSLHLINISSIDLWKMWLVYPNSLALVKDLQLDFLAEAPDGYSPGCSVLVPSLPVQHLVVREYPEYCIMESILCTTNQHNQAVWNNLKEAEIIVLVNHLVTAPLNPRLRFRSELESALSRVVNWFSRYGGAYKWQRSLDNNECVLMSYKLTRITSIFV